MPQDLMSQAGRYHRFSKMPTLSGCRNRCPLPDFPAANEQRRLTQGVENVDDVDLAFLKPTATLLILTVGRAAVCVTVAA